MSPVNTVLLMSG